jgi:hypothetical protein
VRGLSLTHAAHADEIHSFLLSFFGHTGHWSLACGNGVYSQVTDAYKIRSFLLSLFGRTRSLACGNGVLTSNAQQTCLLFHTCRMLRRQRSCSLCRVWTQSTQTQAWLAITLPSRARHPCP